MTNPQVSIGMPIYNGEQLLERALSSLMNQTFQDFELIVSDNASTDRTQEICEHFARQDPRIRYIRQEKNIGAGPNFMYVLDQAQASHFMWAAHDDVWEPDCIKANYEVLAAHPDVVLSVSRVEFVSEHGQIVNAGETGTYPLLGTMHENLVRYLSSPAQNSRFYGLFRTHVIRQCIIKARPMWADDWLIMARTLTFGKHFEVDRCLFRRSPDGTSSRPAELIGRLYKSSLLRAMPMLPYTWAVLKDPFIPKTRGVLWQLFRWNRFYFNKILVRRLDRLNAWHKRVKSALLSWQDDPSRDNATMLEVQRLLSESVLGDKPAIERFTTRGGAVDCDALLGIPCNSDFIDAAFRQIYGREVTDKARVIWLKRLKRFPRSYLIHRLRWTKIGRTHAVRMAGPWYHRLRLTAHQDPARS